MSKIKLLDKSVYNRIAAGEVVERPLSIVKELVENSIDAGATAISVAIEDGGMKKISVSDNGSGILPEDVPTAFMAHATSKIATAADLDGIATLGFRGEALPSIAAVSCVKMNTRVPGSETGFTYCVDNGEVTDAGACGCPFGTSVTVTHLFDKIPARKKFLDKQNKEESAITGTMEKLILANANVSFKYTVNGKVVYSSAGQGVENAIYAVYGKEFFDGLIKTENSEFGITLHGYVCKPSASKHTKGYQTLIVNGRYVISDEVSYWIYGCYMNYLMKRQYPAYVLYLDMPFDLVDVNVHPNKLEIKFADDGIVKKVIVDAVKKKVLSTLMSPAGFAEEVVFDAAKNAENSTQNIYIEEKTADFEPVERKFVTHDKFDSSVLGEIITKKVVADKFDPCEPQFLNDKEDKNFNILKSSVADITNDKEKSADKTFFERLSAELDENSITPYKKDDDNRSIEKQAEEDLPEEKDVRNLRDNNDISIDRAQQQSFETEPTARYCGKIFNTYLIYECGDDAFVIDQHAAHERILFDRLIEKFTNKSVIAQNLLIPYTFTLHAEEGDLLCEAMDNLDKCGFHFERYEGSTFSLKSIPVECSEMDLNQFLGDLIGNVINKNSLTKTDVLYGNLAQWACKAAIKGGMDVPTSEIDKLISDMLSDGRVLVCPHGRPIVLKINKNDVEKAFKRIV